MRHQLDVRAGRGGRGPGALRRRPGGLGLRAGLRLLLQEDGRPTAEVGRAVEVDQLPVRLVPFDGDESRHVRRERALTVSRQQSGG